MPNAETSQVDEILTIAAKRKARPCPVCETLSDSHKATITEARSRGASVPAIVQWLDSKTGKGTYTEHQIKGHFLRGCTK